MEAVGITYWMAIDAKKRMREKEEEQGSKLKPRVLFHSGELREGLGGGARSSQLKSVSPNH